MNHHKSIQANRGDSRFFSSRWCTLRRTYTSADLIGLLYIRLSLPLTIFLPSRFAPSARHMVGVSPCAYDMRGHFRVNACFSMRGEKDLLVGTAVMTAVMSANRVGLGSYSSRCCTFRHTHTSADPIRLLLCIRLALTICAQWVTYGPKRLTLRRSSWFFRESDFCRQP